MSEETKKPAEPTEVVRKLVVPPESQVKAEDGDRSPSKTERDLDGVAIAKTKQDSTQATETVRKLVVPEE